MLPYSECVQILYVCTCVSFIIVAHPCWIMQVGRGNWSPLPLGSIYGSVCKGIFRHKKGALNFKWDSREGLKRRRSKSVEGFTLHSSSSFTFLLHLLLLLSLSLSLSLSRLSSLLLSLSLSLSVSLSCQPFQKASIFSHQAVGACCHVAMLPECQTECQSDGRVWMYNKDGASSDQRPTEREKNGCQERPY